MASSGQRYKEEYNGKTDVELLELKWRIKSVMVIIVYNILEKTFALNLRVEMLAMRAANISFFL